MIWRDSDQYKLLYDSNPSYGSDGNRNTSLINALINKFQIKSVFDFGCGRNHTLLNSLKNKNKNTKFYGYDPAIITADGIGHNSLPNANYQLLISTDCLEHIYQDELSAVWDIFSQIDPTYMFLIICTRPAVQLLPDGSNAHKTVQSGSCWFAELRTHLPNYEIQYTNQFYEENVKKEAHFWLQKITVQ